MKKIKLLLFITLISIVFSCNKDDVTELNPDLITGEWRMEKVTLNGIDGTEFNDYISQAILYIGEDESYYRDYISGNWIMSEKTLSLIPLYLDYGERNYEILELTEDTLQMKIELTESEYFVDLELFDSSEIITIIETYKRRE